MGFAEDVAAFTAVVLSLAFAAVVGVAWLFGQVVGAVRGWSDRRRFGGGAS